MNYKQKYFNIMKKFLISVFALCGLLFPLLAQVDHDYNPNDRVPIVNTTITKEQVPAAVVKAVNTQFDKNNVLTWSKFPFALKEYGWVYDQGASDIKLNRYEVTMKTNSGDELWAVYGADGVLVETRETFKNSAIPPSVMESLAKSQYKDWAIIGDKEVIRYYHDADYTSVEQHYRLTVQKDNVKRSISFNYQNKATK
jgi:hypothetical protein